MNGRVPDPADTLAAAASLQHAVEGLTTQIAEVAADARHSRTLIRFMIPTLIFDVVMSLLLGYVTWRTVDASHQLQTVKAAAAETCVAGNKTRAEVISLWDQITGIVFAQPAQQDEKAKILQIVDDTYAARDCTAVTRG